MDPLAVRDSLLTILSILIVSAVIGHSIWFSLQERRTERLRKPMGGAESSSAVKPGAGQRPAQLRLEEPADRMEDLNIRILAPSDRIQFVESWAIVQAGFADNPGGAVTNADQLLGNVMSTRGFPMNNFEQRVAEISVEHPMILDNYRAAHQRALRHMRGRASTEDLCQAMFHYRVLFEELIGEPQAARS